MVMWGEVVEKLMMWGQGEDDTKGRVSLITTYIYIYMYDIDLDLISFFLEEQQRLANMWTHGR